MKTTTIPFLQGDVVDSKFPINLTLMPNYFNGRNAMVGTPGLDEKFDPSYEKPVRGLLVTNDQNYLVAVIGNRVYIIDKDWNSAIASTTLDSNEGHISIVANLTQIIITDGTDAYIATTSALTITVTKITSSLAGSAKFARMLDHYFIVGLKDTFYYQLSGISDGLTWSGSDLGSVEGNVEYLQSGIVDHRQLILFKETVGEVHYNSGNAVFPFEKYPDVYIEAGIMAPNSLAKFDNSIVWLDNTKTLKRLQGFTPAAFAPVLLNRNIYELSGVADAICFTYDQSGFEYLVITFPAADKTYVINSGTGFAHQWSSGLKEGRHRANCIAFFDYKHVVGDYENGKIYAMNTAAMTDANSTILRKYYSPNYYSGGNVLFHKAISLEFKPGVGLVSGQGVDPKVMLTRSNDGMKTWSNEQWRNLGAMGTNKREASWRRQGSDINRIYEVSVTDPIEVVFTDKNVNISEG